jgi:hypothetical protein
MKLLLKERQKRTRYQQRSNQEEDEEEEEDHEFNLQHYAELSRKRKKERYIDAHVGQDHITY